MACHTAQVCGGPSVHATCQANETAPVHTELSAQVHRDSVLDVGEADGG